MRKERTRAGWTPSRALPVFKPRSQRVVYDENEYARHHVLALDEQLNASLEAHERIVTPMPPNRWPCVVIMIMINCPRVA